MTQPKRNNPSRPPPPDQPSRDKVLRELDTTFLVEAAAGTGKTTCMVGRMVGLIREGKCTVDTLAAVTFTRKAAAELRLRFQVELELAARAAAGQQRERLNLACDNVERCFIGTIHSFCARLLRERPVEAGVDLAFEEIDETDDEVLRAEAWAQHVAALYAEDSPMLAELDDAGLDVSQLENAFRTLAQYPDVDQWPSETVAMPDLLDSAEKLRQYAAHMRSLLPTFPDDVGRDKLMPRYRMLERMIRMADLTRPADLMAVVERFTKASVVQRNWPGGAKQGKAEKERYEDCIDEVAMPLLERWREHRYEKVLRVVRGALAAYDRLRQARGVLNFQDLLMKAASLLCDKPAVRRYFRRRFTHVLVDEFQDTDPIQAQVMLLLTADDPGQTDWRLCRPAAGALFVVGDPKQSIYRFRRADIVTYNQVKRIIAQCGQVLDLSTNFRCRGTIIDWVNGVFDGEFNNFPEDRDDMPRNVPLQTGLAEAPSDLAGVYRLEIPAEAANKSAALEYDADFIARFIRKALDDGMTVARSGKIAPAAPGDFMVLLYKRDSMLACARRLRELGIPHEITGGSSLNQVAELGLLHKCLQALVEADNPIALVALLRSEVFGISDAWLYEFSKAGGRFNFRSRVPEDMDAAAREAFADAFDRLGRYASWLARLPLAAAVEKIAQDLGLFARAAAQDGGDVQCGSLAKAIELVRSAQAAKWSAAEMAEYVGQLVGMEQKFDGVSARPSDQAPVRIMNLHKAKGLEAPVVLLACPAGTPHKTGVELHIDRAGQASRGYLSVTGEPGRHGPRPVLAQPVGWNEFKDREKAFLDAEAKRLLYVAATRAGSAMIISQRQSRKGDNFWGFFEKHMGDVPVLADPGPRIFAAAKQETFAFEQVRQAMGEIAERQARLVKPSYELVSARGALGEQPVRLHGGTGALPREFLQRGGAPVPPREEDATPPADGEHGTEWGTAIHALLEAVATNPAADLAVLAPTILAENDLAVEHVARAIETVRAVAASEIWQRASRSQQRLVEVPIYATFESHQAAVGPAILRGVIDLAFWDADGWVIVDYKTDASAHDRQHELVEHYRPQLEAYCRAWQQATGLKVKQAGLLFTRTGIFVTTSLLNG